MSWKRSFCVILLMVMAGTIASPSVHGQEIQVQLHTVEEGETLFRISRVYHTSVERLMILNDLEDSTIRPGEQLIVNIIRNGDPRGEQPAAGASDEDLTPIAVIEGDLAEERESHEGAVDDENVQSTDVESEAAEESEIGNDGDLPPLPEADDALAELDEEDVSAEASDEEELLPINDDELLDAPRQDAAVSNGAVLPEGLYGSHVVEAGESLYTIAGRYGISADTLLALNDPFPMFLAEGDTLRLPGSFAGYTYEVQPGETLTDVAQKYGVSIRGLQHVNQLEAQSVEPGQMLLIPGRPAPEPEPRGTLPPESFSGMVQVYPAAFAGRLTASGEPYDPSELVVSHGELPFGTVVLLTNPQSGRNSFARIVDRGPLEEDFVMDVSAAVAEALKLNPEEPAELEIRVVDQPD